jgi:hypothetical protein
MLYYLRVLEAMGIENDDEGSSSNKDDGSDEGDLEVDFKPDLQFEDC